jgi:hypothetical protein
VAWPGVLELGERFFETLLEHAVPLDPVSISALKSSALRLDLRLTAVAAARFVNHKQPSPRRRHDQGVILTGSVE